MKTQQQTAWAFAKLALVALAFALGAVACVGDKFDLSVTAFSVNSSSAVTGDAITLSATVGNDASATASSPAATLRYYRSPDATITPDDTEVGANSMGELAAAATSDQTAADSPSVAGIYYYGACVMAEVAGDSDPSNDCSAGVQVDVVAREFDLSVTAFSVDSSSAVTGDDITLNATVGNDSPADHPSPAAELKYYRSPDATITSDDIEVGANSMGALAAASTSDESANVSAPSAVGAYYYGACIVATDDSDPSNNCSDGASVEVVARCSAGQVLMADDRCELAGSGVIIAVDSGGNKICIPGLFCYSIERLSFDSIEFNGVRFALTVVKVPGGYRIDVLQAL